MIELYAKKDQLKEKALKPLLDEIVDAVYEEDGLSDGITAQDFPARILLEVTEAPASGGETA